RKQQRDGACDELGAHHLISLKTLCRSHVAIVCTAWMSATVSSFTLSGMSMPNRVSSIARKATACVQLILEKAAGFMFSLHNKKAPREDREELVCSPGAAGCGRCSTDYAAEAA